jgi:predicted DNA-binding protein YlxM (UPF0122 family)
MITKIGRPRGPRGRPSEKNKIDVVKALKLRLRGNSDTDIAKIYGVSTQAINQGLQRFTKLISSVENGKEIAAYREVEAELLDSARLEILVQMVDRAADKRNSVNNLAYAFRQLFDSSRLLRGRSTANISTLSHLVAAANAKEIPQGVVVGSKDNVRIDVSS